MACGIFKMDRLREMIRRLHIFNPETEYALASGSPYYTPPAAVVSLREKNALLPSLYAGVNDAILIPDSVDTSVADSKISEMPYYENVISKYLTLLRSADLEDWSGFKATPWGWNQQIKRHLAECCPGINGLPDDRSINSLRNLAHRRTVIPFLNAIGSLSDGIVIPVELTSVQEALDFYHDNPAIFLKAPWSSSGRGVMRTDDLEPKHVEPWIRGIIRSQGSVMAEPIYKKSLDMATEWDITSEGSRFMGVSVFEASGRGKYHHNIIGSQDVLWDIINKKTEKVNMDLIERQRKALDQVIAPFYQGPAGIDMLVLENGEVDPCVELNLRYTMGWALL